MCEELLSDSGLHVWGYAQWLGSTGVESCSVIGVHRCGERLSDRGPQVWGAAQ